MSSSRPGFGVVIYSSLAFVLGTYFTFASVQGDYGLFRRIQVEAETKILRAEAAALRAEAAALRAKTKRLSDDYLDLDLLDQQARAILGYVRTDEIVLR